MIDKKEYLRAKKIIEEYENKHILYNKNIYNIAVISSNILDFEIWKKENNLVGEGFDAVKKFKIKNKVYYCILNVNDLVSLNITEVIETKSAKINAEYNEILSILNEKLKK